MRNVDAPRGEKAGPDENDEKDHVVATVMINDKTSQNRRMHPAAPNSNESSNIFSGQLQYFPLQRCP